MIPKIIHYCWFGGNALPELAVKCIESWKKFFPDYEIKLWDESNFDIDSIPYTQEAYFLKKYAYVSDYARYWILFHYGGLYFDTDVEVIKGMTDIIERGAFMGVQSQQIDETKQVTSSTLNIAPGLGLGATPGLDLYKEVLDYYRTLHFVNFSGKMSPTIVRITTEILKNKESVEVEDGIFKVNNELFVYPEDYFCPLNYWTHELNITKNTRSIHHYMASWVIDKKDNKLSKLMMRWKCRIVFLLSKANLLRYL